MVLGTHRAPTDLGPLEQGTHLCPLEQGAAGLARVPDAVRRILDATGLGHDRLGLEP